MSFRSRTLVVVLLLSVFVRANTDFDEEAISIMYPPFEQVGRDVTLSLDVFKLYSANPGPYHGHCRCQTGTLSFGDVLPPRGVKFAQHEEGRWILFEGNIDQIEAGLSAFVYTPERNDSVFLQIWNNHAQTEVKMDVNITEKDVEAPVPKWKIFSPGSLSIPARCEAHIPGFGIEFDFGQEYLSYENIKPLISADKRRIAMHIKVQHGIAKLPPTTNENGKLVPGGSGTTLMVIGNLTAMKWALSSFEYKATREGTKDTVSVSLMDSVPRDDEEWIPDYEKIVQILTREPAAVCNVQIPDAKQAITLYGVHPRVASINSGPSLHILTSDKLSYSSSVKCFLTSFSVGPVQPSTSYGRAIWVNNTAIGCVLPNRELPGVVRLGLVDRKKRHDITSISPLHVTYLPHTPKLLHVKMISSSTNAIATFNDAILMSPKVQKCANLFQNINPQAICTQMNSTTLLLSDTDLAPAKMIILRDPGPLVTSSPCVSNICPSAEGGSMVILPSVDKIDLDEDDTSVFSVQWVFFGSGLVVTVFTFVVTMWLRSGSKALKKSMRKRKSKQRRAGSPVPSVPNPKVEKKAVTVRRRALSDSDEVQVTDLTLPPIPVKKERVRTPTPPPSPPPSPPAPHRNIHDDPPVHRPDARGLKRTEMAAEAARPPIDSRYGRLERAHLPKLASDDKRAPGPRYVSKSTGESLTGKSQSSRVVFTIAPSPVSAAKRGEEAVNVAGPMWTFETSKDRSIRKWYMRYFSLRFPGDMRYFHSYSQMTARKAPIGSVQMASVLSVTFPTPSAIPHGLDTKYQPWAICISTPKKKHYFAARDSEEHKLWMRGIDEWLAVNKAKRSMKGERRGSVKTSPESSPNEHITYYPSTDSPTFVSETPMATPFKLASSSHESDAVTSASTDHTFSLFNPADTTWAPPPPRPVVHSTVPSHNIDNERVDSDDNAAATMRLLGLGSHSDDLPGFFKSDKYYDTLLEDE